MIREGKQAVRMTRLNCHLFRSQRKGLPDHTGDSYIVTPEPSSILLPFTAAAGGILTSRRKRA